MRDLVHSFISSLYENNPITKVQYYSNSKHVVVYQDSYTDLLMEIHDYGNDNISSHSSIFLSLKINAYFVLDDRDIDLYIREWCENNYSKLRFV